MSDVSERYDIRMMAAYVRGMLGQGGPLFNASLERLTEGECEALLEAGRAAGLKLHHFKRHEALPRVKAVMGLLRGGGQRSGRVPVSVHAGIPVGARNEPGYPGQAGDAAERDTRRRHGETYGAERQHLRLGRA